ncbi:MAG: right-handed parallel beta-helix repeat-containing protein [Chlamydiales bacterium]|nr:right-handed parallel beta-helix repeat-containing protein [Chlamydiales bacterium]
MMKKLFLLSMLLSTLCASPALPSYFPKDTSDCMGGIASHGYVRHREHEGVGYKTGYTTLGGFITPNTLREFQPFLDLRAHIMNDGKWASNTGFGFRHAPMESFAWGVNAFFDYRQVKHLPSKQAGVGVEFLSNILDFRINGYFPFGDKTYLSSAKFDRFEGFNVYAKEKVKVSQTSMYAEVGGFIPGPFKVVDLYAAVGPYYLFTRSYTRFQGFQEKTPAAWGGKLRLAAKAWDGIDFGMDVTYDHIFKWNVQGYITLSYPFGPANTRKEGKRWKRMYKTEKCERVADFRRMMTQPVERNEIIPVLEKHLVFALRNPEDTALLLDCIFVNNLAPAGGDGSFENPFNTLQQAEAASIPFDCIYVYGDGPNYTVDGANGFSLQEGQRITGSAIAFDLCDCGVIFPPQTVNAPVVEQVQGGGAIFTLADQTLIQGFELIRGADNGIVSAPGSNNFTIQYNTISDMTNSGILIENLSGGTQTIQNNTFSNNLNGISYDTVTNTSVLIDNNLFDENDSRGMTIIDFGDGTLRITNNEINNNGGIVGIEIAKVTGGFTTGTTAIYVTDNTFTDPAGSSSGALLINRDTAGNAGSTTVNVEGNNFTNFGRVVLINSYSDSQTVLVNNNTFVRNDGNAQVTLIQTLFDGSDMTVDYINNTVSATGLGGGLFNDFAIPVGQATSTMDTRVQCNTFTAGLPVRWANNPATTANYTLRLTNPGDPSGSFSSMNTGGTLSTVNTFTTTSTAAGCPTTP